MQSTYCPQLNIGLHKLLFGFVCSGVQFIHLSDVFIFFKDSAGYQNCHLDKFFGSEFEDVLAFHDAVGKLI